METHAHPRQAIAKHNSTAILDATEELITLGREPSIVAVAEAAGVSRPTIYAHFPDRRRLLEAVVERTVSQAVVAIKSAHPERGPGNVALARVIEASWQQLGRHETVAAVAASELTSDAVHRAHASARTLLLGPIKRGQQDGSISRALPSKWLAAAILSLIHTAAQETRSGSLDRGTATALLRRSTEALCVESTGCASRAPVERDPP